MTLTELCFRVGKDSRKSRSYDYISYVVVVIPYVVVVISGKVGVGARPSRRKGGAGVGALLSQLERATGMLRMG